MLMSDVSAPLRDSRANLQRTATKATTFTQTCSKVNRWCSDNAIVKVQVTMPTNYVYILNARIALSSRTLSHVCVHLTQSIPLTHPGAPANKVLPQGLEVMLERTSDSTWSGVVDKIHYRLISEVLEETSSQISEVLEETSSQISEVLEETSSQISEVLEETSSQIC